MSRRFGLLAAAAVSAVPYVTRQHRGRIVFTSFHGRGYRGNPRAIFEHLLEQAVVDVVWLATEESIVRQVRERFGRQRAEMTHSLAGARALAGAAAVVLSHGITDLPYLHLPRRAIVLQSWHGLPTKRGELTAEGVTPLRRFAVRRQWAPVTHLLSSSPFVSEQYAARFGLTRSQCVELGYPQYDALCKPEGAPLDTGALFPEAPKHERVVLYAPTFRKRTATQFFPFADASPEKIDALLASQNALLCLRPHPNDRLEAARVLALSPRIVLADDQRIEDVVPLLSRSDLVITDYSSIYLEGLLADVPCLFVPYDLNEYERGLPWDYAAHTPGPKVASFAEFERALRRALEDRAHDREERRRVRRIFFTHDDGRATERVASWLRVVAGAQGRQ